MDLDQKLFTLELGLGDDAGFETAMAIYSLGSFSYPIAILQLDAALLKPMPKDATVNGLSIDNKQVKGLVDGNYNVGDTEIRVRYETNEVQDSYVGCVVAANPVPILDGCFQADGFIIVSGFTTPLDYKYDPETANVSGRSMSKMSTTAAENMGDDCTSPNCPYPDFTKFESYYGVADYADKWIRSAADRQVTPFVNGGSSFIGMSQDGAYGTYDSIAVLQFGVATTPGERMRLQLPTNGLTVASSFRGHDQRNGGIDLLDVCDSGNGAGSGIVRGTGC